MTDVAEVDVAEEKGPEGLGGWLILVGLGIIVSPVRILVEVFPVYLELFRSGAWEVLTTPGSEAYSPLWSPILVGEILVNLLLVLAWIYVLWLFFTKRAAFPTWFIGLTLVNLGFIVFDALAIQLVIPDQPLFDQDTATELARSMLVAIVWIPYMLVSRRVKATFTR